LGDSWVTALFLAGLLMGFRNPSLKRLRYFLVSCLAVLTIVQALGRTQLSDQFTEINSENLLVLVAPVALMYGVSLFFILLDQIKMPFPQLRYCRGCDLQRGRLLLHDLCFFAAENAPLGLPAVLSTPRFRILRLA